MHFYHIFFLHNDVQKCSLREDIYIYTNKQIKKVERIGIGQAKKSL